jgi:hypothetical protein
LRTWDYRLSWEQASGRKNDSALVSEECACQLSSILAVERATPEKPSDVHSNDRSTSVCIILGLELQIVVNVTKWTSHFCCHIYSHSCAAIITHIHAPLCWLLACDSDVQVYKRDNESTRPCCSGRCCW